MEMCCYCGGGNLSEGAVDCEDTASYSITKGDIAPYGSVYDVLVYALGRPLIPRNWSNLYINNINIAACDANWSYKLEVSVGPTPNSITLDSATNIVTVETSQADDIGTYLVTLSAVITSTETELNTHSYVIDIVEMVNPVCSDSNSEAIDNYL